MTLKSSSLLSITLFFLSQQAKIPIKVRYTSTVFFLYLGLHMGISHLWIYTNMLIKEVLTTQFSVPNSKNSLSLKPEISY